MIRRAFLALAISCSLAVAQKPKIESAPAEPPATPVAGKKLPDKLEKPPAPEPPKRTPDEIVGTFFEALKADRVDPAYDTLKAEFAMADRGDAEAQGMRTQTQKALDAYGPVLGYELVREEKLGTHLLRRTYVLIGQVLPLRWKFYFYNPEDRWLLIDLRIDDGIAEWFDESAKAAKPAK
jgi:hypothetical protein